MSKPFAAKGVGACARVDFHTWALLKGVAISTLLGVGANVTFSGESDLVQAIRESTQQNLSRAGDQITSRNLQIQPTITIRPGASVRLIVHRDLILAPWRGYEEHMPELKLPKLPDRTPIKLPITVTPDLHQMLQEYAALYAESYGREEPIAELIPAMLTAFLESDRGFARSRTRS